MHNQLMIIEIKSKTKIIFVYVYLIFLVYKSPLGHQITVYPRFSELIHVRTAPARSHVFYIRSDKILCERHNSCCDKFDESRYNR